MKHKEIAFVTVEKDILFISILKGYAVYVDGVSACFDKREHADSFGVNVESFSGGEGFFCGGYTIVHIVFPLLGVILYNGSY